MKQQPDDERSGRSAAVAILLGTSAGIGVGVAIAYPTGNPAVSMGLAAGMGVLFRNMLRKGKK